MRTDGLECAVRLCAVQLEEGGGSVPPWLHQDGAVVAGSPLGFGRVGIVPAVGDVDGEGLVAA